MSEQNKATLQRANAEISRGNNEGFLEHCHEDVVWSTVGGETLNGKKAVREWMAANYIQPPRYTVTQLIGEGDHVAALGEIWAKNDAGVEVRHSYCDVWRFRGDKMAELRAFVIETPGE
jgi:ketosteroid isomerase-like protein